MLVGESQELQLDKWSVIALQEDWVGRWNQSAMFPSELAFLLAFCEHAGIKRMFESGRYEGYSTERLAAYAARKAPMCIRSIRNPVRRSRSAAGRACRSTVCPPHEGRRF